MRCSQRAVQLSQEQALSGHTKAKWVREGAHQAASDAIALSIDRSHPYQHLRLSAVVWMQ